MNAVELHSVYQQYGSMAVLDNINLTLAEGEVLGLFGHNGAGKTTTVRLILGLLQATTGQVKVLDGTPGDSDIRRQIGFHKLWFVHSRFG